MEPLPGQERAPVTVDELLGVADVERVLKRLTRHAEGIQAMTATEVQAAKIVLGKRMPDVKSVEHTGTVNVNYDAAVLALLRASAQ